MNKNLRERKGCLELRRASYLCEVPENPAWSIDYWYPNPYYKNEDKYIKNGDWYEQPDIPHFRIHKDCFKNPQSCFSIANFEYDKHEGIYELHFVGDRPVELTEDERKVFWDLITLGYRELNKPDEEDDEDEYPFPREGAENPPF